MKTTLFSKLDTIDFEEITNKNISNGKDTRITMDGKKKKVEDMIIHEVKISSGPPPNLIPTIDISHFA